MKEIFVVTNANTVVEIGYDGIRRRINAGKCEVENDIAAFIYYPCLAVVNRHATFADVTSAFNYKGLPSRDGTLTFIPERLIRFFEKERDDKIYVNGEETNVVYIRFNPEYEETLADVNFAREEHWAKRTD